MGGSIVRGAGTPMLLDLHNLHASSENFGFDARAYIDSLPPRAIRSIHLAGGRRVGTRSTARPRIVDDHLHDVPDAVFDLLEYVAERVEPSLTVILERDGNYPAFETLRNELRRARAAVARGRSRRTRGGAAVAPTAGPGKSGGASTERMESVLARLYTEGALRAAFLADARGVARQAGLGEADAAALVAIDREGLELAARSYDHKRRDKARAGGERG